MKLKLLQVTVKQMLTDEFIQNWYRGEFYGFFKEEFGLENYLLKLLPKERVMISIARTPQKTNNDRQNTTQKTKD
jgi:hypothetical protein